MLWTPPIYKPFSEDSKPLEGLLPSVASVDGSGPPPAPVPAPPLDFSVVRRLDAEVEGPYRLREDVASQLWNLADSDCMSCLGTGVSRWRAGGMAANICKCVRAHECFQLPDLELEAEGG
jgi:hypothetical protein